MNLIPPELAEGRTFEEMLAAARRRVHRAAVWSRVPVACERALWTVVCVAGLLALIAAVSLLGGREAPFGWTGYAGLLILAFAAVAAATVLPAFLHPPSLMEAAQRLDLGAGEHNRVAIGLDLARQKQSCPFARAAIDDGLTWLGRIRDGAPLVERSRPRWRTLVGLGVVFIALTCIAGLCNESGRGNGAAAGTTLAQAGPPIDRFPAALPEVTDRLPVETPAPNPNKSPGAFNPSKEANAASDAADNSRAERAAGHARIGAGGTMESKGRSAGAGGEPSGDSASSSSRKDQANRRKAPNRNDSREAPQEGAPTSAQSSSSTSAGSAGGGSPSPVQNDWGEHAQTAEDDSEDEDRDEPVEDERESSTQRGGIQPMLKDRQEAPSRELGISGSQGPPGTGRGGPTPPKKSRGTASLVLGVPVPDFVKGRLGPGTTKTTRRRVQPSTNPGEPTKPVDVAERSMPEASCPQFDAPSEYAEIVRRYLVALHSADAAATEADSDATTSTPESPEE